MKTIALLLTCALLAVGVSPFFQTVSASTQPSPTALQGEGKKSPREIMNDLKIERRKGESVRLRADQLRRKNKAVAKAMHALENRGMRPAFEAGVSIVAARRSGQQAKISAQETTIIDGDYELTFIPYDDGNNATWEGVIYFKRPEGEVVYDAQLDISTTTPTVIYEHRYGGTGKELRGVAKATRPVQLSKVSHNSEQPVITTAIQIGGITAWAWCAAIGCWSAAAGCAVAGPGWAHCAAAACFGIMLQCAFTQLIFG